MIQPAPSFRDPAGSCRFIGDRVLRVLHAESAANCEAFLQTDTARKFAARGQLVGTHRLTTAEAAALRESSAPASAVGAPAEFLFEHERIGFPSYPYEWPPEMLWEAAELTLELAQSSAKDGYGLKDATPYNVLFRGGEAVFIDLPSFERRAEGDPVWLAYAQFVRTFLLPLLANRRWGIRMADIFITRRDGLEPEEVYKLCGGWERFKPQILSLVSIPTWLGNKARAQGEQLHQSRTLANAEKGRFIFDSVLQRLRGALESLKPPARKVSAWSDYMDNHGYDETAFKAKEKFVTESLGEFRPKRLLDVGANTGYFSRLAARAGAEVVAIDSDPACVGALWRGAREEKANILPLVLDLSRPSPALGWANAECRSFLDRAAGAFDCVMALAVIHHLLVTERVPLEEILRLLSELTTSLLIIEFVPPEDEMFRQLTRGREHLHASLNEAAFEQVCGVHFIILKSLQLPGSRRRLYSLRRKGPAVERGGQRISDGE